MTKQKKVDRALSRKKTMIILPQDLEVPNPDKLTMIVSKFCPQICFESKRIKNFEEVNNYGRTVFSCDKLVLIGNFLPHFKCQTVVETSTNLTFFKLKNRFLNSSKINSKSKNNDFF